MFLLWYVQTAAVSTTRILSYSRMHRKAASIELNVAEKDIGTRFFRHKKLPEDVCSW